MMKISEKMKLPETKKLSKKKLFLICLALALAALGIYRIADSLKPPALAEKEPVNVKIATAKLDTISVTSPIMGRIDPLHSASVVPLTAGQVTSVKVNLGDYVEEGSLLFELDKTQSAVAYNQAKLAYDSAKSDYDRISLLYKEGAVSQQQYQGVKTQFNLAEQSRKAAAEALSYCTITAPISGYVTSVNVAEGGLAAQSMPAVTIADTSALEINASVSDFLIGKIAIGDKVDINVTSLTDQKINGTVKALSPAPALGTLTYPITISVDNPPGSVKAGMFAQVMIISERRENVLCVPSDAVFMKSGEPKVAVLKDKIPSLVTVTVGLDNGILAEITTGLSEGDKVVVTGQQFITEGEAVNIITD